MDTVAVLFGGPSAEHDVSILTGLQAGRILAGTGRAVRHVYWSTDRRFFLVPDDLEAADFLQPEVRGAVEIAFEMSEGFVKRARFSSRPIETAVVVNCCHGGPGEDGTLTAMLAVAGLRVTGPQGSACALAMDKVATAALAGSLGIPGIPTSLLTEGTPTVEYSTPWIIKPRYGGSSLGIEANVVDLDTAKVLAQQGACRSGAIVQPYLEGWQDLNVAVRTHPTLEVSVIERPLRPEGRIYGYADKYLGSGGAGMDGAPRELPAVVPEHVSNHIRDAASTLATAMALTGVPRIDFLWDPHTDNVLLCEVNAIPGALGLYLWEAQGQSRATVLNLLVEEAQLAPVTPPHWDGRTDRAALRAARAIASKLA